MRNAFATLDDVAQGDYTKWSVVYDIGAKRVYFRTALARKVRWIDVATLGFACHRGASMLDVNAPLSGDVTARLQPYDAGANRALVNTAFAKTPFLAGATEQERDEMARYPETTACAEPARKRGK